MFSKLIVILLLQASVRAVEYTPATSYSSINRYSPGTKSLALPVTTYQTAPTYTTYQSKPLDVQQPITYHTTQVAPAVATYQTKQVDIHHPITYHSQLAPAVHTYQTKTVEQPLTYHTAQLTPAVATYQTKAIQQPLTHAAYPLVLQRPLTYQTKEIQHPVTYQTKPLAIQHPVTYHTSPEINTYQTKPLAIQHPITYHSSPEINTYQTKPLAIQPTLSVHSAHLSSGLTTYQPVKPVEISTLHTSPAVATYHPVKPTVTTYHPSAVTTLHTTPVIRQLHTVPTLVKQATPLDALHGEHGVTTVLSKDAFLQSHYAPAHYEFEYGVQDHHTGDIKSQHEIGNEGVVKGEYSLVQPDGSTRTVTYTADEHNGFNAKVEYSGHSTHPHPAKALVEAAPIVKSLGLH